jgi:hypothetical protein
VRKVSQEEEKIKKEKKNTINSGHLVQCSGSKPLGPNNYFHQTKTSQNL